MSNAWLKITDNSPDHPFAFERTWIVSSDFDSPLVNNTAISINVVEKKEKKKPSSQDHKVISDFSCSQSDKHKERSPMARDVNKGGAEVHV